jgi:hypothetical protein
VRKVFLVIFVFLLSVLFKAHSKDYALILGGGCGYGFGGLGQEMFEESFGFAENIKKRGWDVLILHSNSKRTKELNMISNNKYNLNNYNLYDFTKDNIKASLEKINNEIKKDDKLLINIITHGLPVSSKKGHTQGHFICIEDVLNFNVNQLKNMGLDAIYQKGAKIGIIDNSCYGGESIYAFNDIACVLSTQSFLASGVYARDFDSNKKYNGVFGLTSIVTRYLENNKNNKSLSLEDYYLKALLDNPSWSFSDPKMMSNFPNISCDEKGNSLSNFAAIYSFINSNQRDSININYGENEICNDLTAIEKTKVNKIATKNEYENCVIELEKSFEEKYRLLENIRYFLNFKKKSLGLDAKKTRNIEKELKELVQKLEPLSNNIKNKEKLLNEKEDNLLKSIDEFLKNKETSIRVKISTDKMQKFITQSSDLTKKPAKQKGAIRIRPKNGLEVPPATYKTVYDKLSEKNCIFLEDLNEIECHTCFQRYYFLGSIFRNREKEKEKYIMLERSLLNIFEHDLDIDVSNFVKSALKEMNFNQKIKNMLDEGSNLLKKYDQLIKQKQDEIEKFNVIFNKFKAIRYIKETPKLNFSNKVRRCRNFKI